jgi:hypothetical protein
LDRKNGTNKEGVSLNEFYVSRRLADKAWGVGNSKKRTTQRKLNTLTAQSNASTFVITPPQGMQILIS